MYRISVLLTIAAIVGSAQTEDEYTRIRQALQTIQQSAGTSVATVDAPSPPTDWRAQVTADMATVMLAAANAASGASTGPSASPVMATGNLQQMLNDAKPGDTIVLEAGATYMGLFTLPAKSGTDYITITSSQLAKLPAAGQRISPADAPLMPKIVSSNGDPVIRTQAGASHYKFVGVEITGPRGVYSPVSVVQIGTGRETAATQLPYDIIFDRVYIHGDPVLGARRGIAMNGRLIALRNSVITDVFSSAYETAAVGAWNTTGPLEISNNRLEAGSISILIGGAEPYLAGVTPADILITRNHLTKPLTWRSRAVISKNLLELKTGKRVTITSNVLENVWAEGQVGYAINLKPGTENVRTRAITSEVLIQNNIIRHAAGGINLTGRNVYGGRLFDVSIVNNLFSDITPQWGAKLPLFSTNGVPENLRIENNTATESVDVKQFLLLNGAAASGLVVRGNIVPFGDYGIKRDGSVPGNPSLAAAAPGAVVTKNVMFNPEYDTARYPAGNYYPATASRVGWTDPAADNYSLSPASPYFTVGISGANPGIAYQLLLSAVANVLQSR